MFSAFLMAITLILLIMNAPFSFSFSQSQSVAVSDQEYFEMMRRIQPESPSVNRKPAEELGKPIVTTQAATQR